MSKGRSQIYSVVTKTELKPSCLCNGLVELCAASSKQTGYELGILLPRVRAAFAAHGR